MTTALLSMSAAPVRQIPKSNLPISLPFMYLHTPLHSADTDLTGICSLYLCKALLLPCAGFALVVPCNVL